MKTKTAKKIIAVILAILLVLSVLPLSAFASDKKYSENTAKEEVVYVNLNSDGSVKDIYVVNAFDTDKTDSIIDYGKYESLRNMTGSDEIEYDNDTVIIDSSSGKLYYEGKLKENSIPWKIQIRYFLDEKEYSADELAGKSGSLRITMSIKQNPSCTASFFEAYALQATFTLNTDIAENIKAEGGTIANVGADKQISYTILPNTEKYIELTADVNDFEMDAVSVNGIRMNLDIEFDESAIREKIDELINAVSELDDGAGELNEGLAELYDGVSELHEGSDELNTAVGDFYSGILTLYDGASELRNGLTTLSSKSDELRKAGMTIYESLCDSAETQLNEQLSENGMRKVSLTPSTYADVLLGVLDELDAGKAYSKAYDTALDKVTEKLDAQADELYQGYIQSQADAIYLTYIRSQSDTLYRQVATQAVLQELVESGNFDTEETAAAYLQTAEGQILIDNALLCMTDEQRNLILTNAVQSLTEEQKTQILSAALVSLTDEQKEQIKNGYINDAMTDSEITSQINTVVKQVSDAASAVSELKGELDSYGKFYEGLLEYTYAVDTAADGAAVLAEGTETLLINADELKAAVGELNIAVGSLKDGSSELKEGSDELKSGADEFVSETSTLHSQVHSEIKRAIAKLTGENIETISFVSSKNTNIEAVQFVMQTESITKSEADTVTADESESLTFWQKLLRLFGLY